MFTVLSRITHFGFKNFWRHGWLSAATVAIMILALLVFVGLIIFGVVADHAASSIQDKIDISVYFKTTTSEDQVLNVKQSLENLSEVKSVEYISSDQALSIFKEAHKDDATISQGINELNSNPLEASLNIKAQQPDQYADIANYLDAPNLSQYIDSVSYAKNQVVIDRLTAIVKGVNRGGWVLTIVLALVAGLVVFNTIRLAIYSGREEIGVMRVVGASNSFVRGPLVVEGIISGILAAVLSMIIAAPIIYFVSPYLKVFIPGLDVFQYFYENLGKLFLYQLIFGVGIGTLSSLVAVRRYLKN
ncbi:MAG: ABC transporter permease [Patescibacteria group bacterium]|nr:ABC transporter permease [Patescibacteria group bacterium]MDE2015499.1 ABC transporter permease [Patescibacteria group bacterium]MDE2226885.1 ABC transporter permease [Patescibacteria group bacterium]